MSDSTSTEVGIFDFDNLHIKFLVFLKLPRKFSFDDVLRNVKRIYLHISVSSVSKEVHRKEGRKEGALLFM